MGKSIKVTNGKDTLEIQDSDLQYAVKDGYLPTERVIVANSKTQEVFEIDPKDLPHAFDDGFSFSGVKKKVGGSLSEIGAKVGAFLGQDGLFTVQKNGKVQPDKYIPETDIEDYNRQFEDKTGHKEFSLGSDLPQIKKQREQEKFLKYSSIDENELKPLQASVYTGKVTPQQLKEVYNKPYGKEFVKRIISQELPEASTLGLDEDVFRNEEKFSAISHALQVKNRPQGVELENEYLKELDSNIANSLDGAQAEKVFVSGNTGGAAATVSKIPIGVTDTNDTEQLGKALQDVINADVVYGKGGEGVDKNDLAAKINEKIYYLNSQKPIHPDVAAIPTDLLNKAIARVNLRRERGETIPIEGFAKNDQLNKDHFLAGLSYIKDARPGTYYNVMKALKEKGDIADLDFKEIAGIGQDIYNQKLFRQSAVDPQLIGKETQLDYTTYQDKREEYSRVLSEEIKKMGIKNHLKVSQNAIDLAAALHPELDNKEIINDIKFDEKLTGQGIVKGGVLSAAYRGIKQPLHAIKETYEAFSKSPVDNYINSRRYDYGDQQLVGKKGDVSSELPSERGNVWLDIVEGTAQFIPQIVLAKGIGKVIEAPAQYAIRSSFPLSDGLSAAQKSNIAAYGGGFVSSMLQTMGSSYTDFLQKTGDPATAKFASFLDALTTSVIEVGVLPDVKVAEKAQALFKTQKNKFVTEVADLVKSGATKSAVKPVINEFLKNTVKIFGGNVTEEILQNRSNYITEMLFSPSTLKDRDSQKEILETAKGASLAMIIPSLFGAAGKTKLQKSLSKDGLNIAAVNFEKYDNALQKALLNNEISQQQYDETKNILSIHRNNVLNAPKRDAKGNLISAARQLEYAFQSTVSDVNNGFAKNQTDKIQQEPFLKKATEADDIKRKIFYGEEDKSLPEKEDKESEFTSRPKEEILADVPNAAKAIQDENIKNQFLSNPEMGLAEAAQQLHGTTGEAEIASKVYGNDLADLALELYPTKESADEAMTKLKPPSIDQGRELDMGSEEITKPTELNPELPEGYVLPEQMEQPTEVNIPKLPESKPAVSGSGEKRSDAEIEKRMAELEDSGLKSGTPETKEYNSLEKEMEKRERSTVFDVPLENVNDAVDALLKKEKDKPNGFGAFIEKRDARETKEVADRYLKAKELTDKELKKDFKDALFGNPTTWYADGLKLRESMKEAANRGIEINDLLNEVKNEFTKDGFDEATARKVIAGMLKPVFEGSGKVNEKQIANETSQESTQSNEPIQAEEVSSPKGEPIKVSETAEGGGEPPKAPPLTDLKEEFGREDRLDKLANNIPDTGKVSEYLSGDTIQKYTGEEPLNDQTRGVQELEIALNHGDKIIEEAKRIFGEDYVEKTLSYIDRSKAGVSNKALMYVSLENELGREKLANPDKAEDISKQQALVYAKSQAFARENSLALNYQKLRKAAQVGYDISKITDNFFSPEEKAAREVINKATEANGDLINEEYAAQQTGGITTEVEKMIQEGIQKEVAKLYEALPKEKKSFADKAIKALEAAQAKLRSRTYDAGLGIPVAAIDAGLTVIKNAIKAGVYISKAIELGINKIKEAYGKELSKEREDKLRNDFEEVFKSVEEAERKAKPVKEIVKEALIQKGFGREINVKGETKQILDWKKLAGEAGLISNIRKNVNEVLQEKGWAGLTDAKKGVIKDDFIQEYVSIRQSIIEKAQSELAKRNKESVTPEQKSAAKKLAELYTYGLFDKEFDTYENTLNKALGAKVSEQGFNDAKKIAKALDNIYKSTFKGVRLNDISAKSAIEKLEDQLRILLYREAKSQGNWNLKLANIVRTFFETSQTMMLNNMKQALENPLSGLQQSALDALQSSNAGASNKELRAQQRDAMKNIYKDMVLKGGITYGKVESQFVNRQHLDDLVNKMSDNKLYHGIASVATGKATLNAMDAMFKAKITETKFTHNLINILTSESNPKRMSKPDALKFVTEKLTGQTYADAQKTAKEVIEKINKDAGQKLIPLDETKINRLANDIVKASLEMGGKITTEQIQAAYNAAYKNAGLNLGHEANNPLSGMIKGYSAKLEGDINRAVKDKQWNRAALLTYKATLFRNILNPFVGGGTNWLVLKLEKTGLGMFTGLVYKYGAKNDIDLSTKEGQKRLEKNLYNQARYKDSFTRGLVGGLVSLSGYALYKIFADDDEYRKWRQKNKWAARYIDVATPEMQLAEMGIKDNKFYQYISQSYNRGDAFDPVNKFIKGVEYFRKGESGKGWGALGEGMGMKINAPVPWRLVKDGQVIYQGVTGQDPYHGNYQPSDGFLSGVLQGGFIEWLGGRPLPKPEPSKQAKVRDNETGKERVLTETEQTKLNETASQREAEILEQYEKFGETIWVDVNGKVHLSKEGNFSEMDKATWEEIQYSKLNEDQLKKLKTDIKKKAKRQAMAELNFGEESAE